MPSKKPRITVYTDQNTIDKFEKIAKEENRSISKEAEKMIIDRIKAYEVEHGKILIGGGQKND